MTGPPAHALPFSDEEMLVFAKWLEKSARANRCVQVNKWVALRLSETLYWALAERPQIPSEPGR